jgi:hypothetical protein
VAASGSGVGVHGRALRDRALLAHARWRRALDRVDFVDIYFSLADEAGQPTFMLFNVTVVQVTDMLTVDYSALRPGPPYRISIGYDNQMSLHVEFLCHANGSDTFGINVRPRAQPHRCMAHAAPLRRSRR